MSFLRLRALALVLLAVAPAACLGSPQEEPEVGPSFAAYPFDVKFISAEALAAEVRFTGAAEAAPGVEEVWAVSLDAPAALVVAPVAADGSFAVDVPGALTDRFRLHGVIALGVEPADVVIDGGDVVAPTDCTLSLSLTEYRDFGAVAVGGSTGAAIELVNLCDGAIELAGSRALAGSGAFALDLGATQTIAPAAFATAQLEFSPTVAGDAIDYLTIDVVGHPPFVLTVRGRGL